MNIQVDTTLCQHCGRCQRVCPTAVFEFQADKGATATRPDGCIACGHCMDVCPSAAIRHEAFPAERVHPVDRNLLPTPQSLMELIRSRRSNRTITDRDIPPQTIADIIEAARYAPTAENSRRVTVTLIEEPSHLQQVEDQTMHFFLRLASVLLLPPIKPITRWLLPDLYAEAPELQRFEQQWRQGQRPCSCNARVMLAFSAPSGYDFGWQDCNLAYQNASLMAETHGVSQIYMGLIVTALKFLGHGKARRLLHLPSGHRLYALMALGMPAIHYHNYTER